MNLPLIRKNLLRIERYLLIARRGFALLISLLLILICQPSVHAVDIDAWVGFGLSGGTSNRYLPDAWNLFTVALTGQGESGQYQLQISVKSGDRTEIYSRHISLHDGSLNEVHCFAIQIKTNNQFRFMGGNTAADITVQLVKDGRKIADKTVSLPTGSDPKTFHVLALTKDGSGLNFLMGKKLGLIHHHFNPGLLGQDNGGGGRGMMGAPFNAQLNGKMKKPKHPEINDQADLYVSYCDTRTLPTMPQAYQMIDAIVLADAPLDNLTEDQTTAIKGFLRDGGLLLISGGGDLTRFKSKFLLDLLPIVPNGVSSVSDIPELAARYGASLNLKEKLALIDGNIRNEGSVLLSQRGSGCELISSRPYGCGKVVFTSFDCYAPELRGWSPAPSMWRDIFLTGSPPISARKLLELHGTGMHSNNLSQSLVDAMAGKPAGNAPSFQTLAIFLGLYLLLLIPVSAMVLKKLDKRELTWITAPCLIIGFTIVSYLIARSLKGNALTLNRVAIIESTANSDQFAGTAQMTLYSPQRADYDIEFGTSEGSNNSYSGYSPSEIYPAILSSAAGSLTVEQDRTPAIRKANVRLWDKRSFGMPITTSPGGPIQVSAKMLNEKLALVSITNGTKYTLKDCSLINSEQSIPLGNMAPGEKREKEIVWINRGGGTSLNLNTSLSTFSGNIVNHAPNDRLSDEEALQSALTQVLSQGRQNGGYWDIYTGDFGRVTTAFTGWFSDPIIDVTINGKRPAGTEMNLLIAHIPTPIGAPPRLISSAEPFRRAPILDLEDEISPSSGKTSIFK